RAVPAELMRTHVRVARRVRQLRHSAGRGVRLEELERSVAVRAGEVERGAEDHGASVGRDRGLEVAEEGRRDGELLDRLLIAVVEEDLEVRLRILAREVEGGAEGDEASVGTHARLEDGPSERHCRRLM